MTPKLPKSTGKKYSDAFVDQATFQAPNELKGQNHEKKEYSCIYLDLAFDFLQ